MHIYKAYMPKLKVLFFCVLCCVYMCSIFICFFVFRTFSVSFFYFIIIFIIWWAYTDNTKLIFMLCIIFLINVIFSSSTVQKNIFLAYIQEYKFESLSSMYYALSIMVFYIYLYIFFLLYYEMFFSMVHYIFWTPWLVFHQQQQ